MGEIRCQIIIVEGNIAYAVAEIFAKNHPSIELAYLQAAVKASCDGVHHASLYFEIEQEDLLTPEYLQPIIDLHKEITESLVSVNMATSQMEINHLAIKLFEATRNIYTLYGVDLHDLKLINLQKLIK